MDATHTLVEARVKGETLTLHIFPMSVLFEKRIVLRRASEIVHHELKAGIQLCFRIARIM
jgi:hypothetical protein